MTPLRNLADWERRPQVGFAAQSLITIAVLALLAASASVSLWAIAEASSDDLTASGRIAIGDATEAEAEAEDDFRTQRSTASSSVRTITECDTATDLQARPGFQSWTALTLAVKHIQNDKAYCGYQAGGDWLCHNPADRNGDSRMSFVPSASLDDCLADIGFYKTQAATTYDYRQPDCQKMPTHLFVKRANSGRRLHRAITYYEDSGGNWLQQHPHTHGTIWLCIRPEDRGKNWVSSHHLNFRLVGWLVYCRDLTTTQDDSHVIIEDDDGGNPYPAEELTSTHAEGIIAKAQKLAAFMC